jgi:hypothetical protein
MYNDLVQLAVLMDKLAPELLEHFKEQAIAAKAAFLPLDLAALRGQGDYEFSQALMNVYQGCALYPDKEIQEKLGAAGLKPLYLRWFIDIKSILEQLDAIIGDGVVKMNRTKVLLLIKWHLDAKINTYLMYWFKFTEPLNDKLYVTRIKADIYKICRRRKRGGGQPLFYKDEYDQKLNELIDFYERAVGDPQQVRRMMLQNLDGNTRKSFLKRIIEICSTAKKNNAFYRRFLHFFSLFAPTRSY